MASFSDKVKVLIDVDSTGATSGLANFRKSWSEAEKASDKWKLATSGAMDMVKANAGAFALGAGAAIAGFAVKAIGDFQKLALEVDHFSDVTGLAAEEASRWTEVAGDMGIESSTVEAAINRMNREIGKGTEKFEALGIEIERTSGGAVDVNETFLNTIEALKNIQDPAERARVAAELLGKGWTGMAELIETGSDNLRESLDSVADAKIIDENEIAKAKRLRELQDNLADSLEVVALTVGEVLLPALETVAGPLEWLGTKMQEASENGFDLSDGALTWLGKKLGILSDDTEDATDETDALNQAWEDGYRAMIDAQTAAEDLGEAFIAVSDALSELKGNVDERQAWRNLQDEFDRTVDAAMTAFSEKTPQAIRDSESALDRLRVEVGEYISQIDNMDTEQKTRFIAELDTANLQQIEAILDNIARTRRAQIIADVFGGTPVTPTPVRPGVPPFAPNPPATITNPTGSNRDNRSAVTVNVTGSVVTEGQLVENIRRGLIDAQRNGKPLVVTGP